jgi:group I intron endonuclease
LKHSYAGLLIDRARNKYGLENWKSEVLKECQTQEELNYWEQYYIKELNTKKPNGYNLTDGGEGCSGYQCSEEHKLKNSLAKSGVNHPNWGKHLSDETKKKISDATKGIRRSLGMTGHHHSDESRKKMSEVRKGKHFSEETRKKMSEAHKRKNYE